MSLVLLPVVVGLGAKFWCGRPKADVPSAGNDVIGMSCREGEKNRKGSESGEGV
jgi:hypothetical protein